jgi:hypothetical protein
MEFHIVELALQFVSRFKRIILLPILHEDVPALLRVSSEIRKMLLSRQKLFGTQFVAVIERRFYFQCTFGVRSAVFVFEITENKRITAYSS